MRPTEEDIIIYVQDIRTSARLGIESLCEMAALGEMARILVSNAPRLSAYENHIAFLNKICERKGIVLIGTEHIGISAMEVAREEQTRQNIQKTNLVEKRNNVGNMKKGELTDEMISIANERLKDEVVSRLR